MIEIDVLLLEGTGASPTGATIDVFGAANRALGTEAFNLRFVAHRRSVRTRGGLAVKTFPFAQVISRPIVIVLGLGVFTEDEVSRRLMAPDAQAAIRWIAEASGLERTIAASCTGVFLLGEAGVLDGRRCVTTWWLGQSLVRRYPTCSVDVNQMVIRDDRVWTAGSAFAHVDLVLGLLASMVDSKTLDEVASRLVFDVRPSQAAFMIPSHLSTQDAIVSELEAYIRAAPEDPHTLAALAERARTSPRTLSRRFRRTLGLSPMQLVRKIRLETSVHLLKSTRLSLEVITRKVGFEDVATLHRLVRQFTGVSPGALRGATGLQRHAAQWPDNSARPRAERQSRKCSDSYCNTGKPLATEGDTGKTDPLP